MVYIGRIMFLMLTIVTCSCLQNKPKTTTRSHFIPESQTKEYKTGVSQDSDRIIDIGYYEKYKTLPQLTFDLIDEKEFLACEYKTSLQSYKPKENDDFFYIQTALKKHTFEKYKNYGGEKSWSGYQLLGYYPSLSLYAITQNSTAESFGFGQLVLLDSLTDYQYNIISFGDGSVELPLPSVQNKYLVYYYNSVYEHKNGCIGVLKVNDQSNPKNYLTEYASYESSEFAIEKIVWQSDTSFLVKGFEEIYENDAWVKKFTYYKTELK